MRLKKHLDERIAACSDVLIAREGAEFYKLNDEQKSGLALDIDKVFPHKQQICLELGCGKGGWAIESAKRNPNFNFIAVEKLSNVIVAACENAKQENLSNLRFINCRAENLLCFLPKHTVSVITLNFSCPYPKKTYANRRLTSKNFLNIYKELLTDDGVITQKTDNLDFFEYSLESLAENGFETYEVTYDLPADAPDNVITEYEKKFREQYIKINALKARIKQK